MSAPSDCPRAKCPHFMSRADYGGESFILCKPPKQKKTYALPKQAEYKRAYPNSVDRDRDYLKYCCAKPDDCVVHHWIGGDT